MKQDNTTNFLLGIIATGVTVLTVLAFEKRFPECLSEVGDELDEFKDRAGNQARKAGRAVESAATGLRDRVDEGVETLKDKAAAFKERFAEESDDASHHLKEGASDIARGFQRGAEDVKQGFGEAADEAGKATNS